jgi:hypothetical protein
MVYPWRLSPVGPVRCRERTFELLRGVRAGKTSQPYIRTGRKGRLLDPRDMNLLSRKVFGRYDRCGGFATINFAVAWARVALGAISCEFDNFRVADHDRPRKEGQILRRFFRADLVGPPTPGCSLRRLPGREGSRGSTSQLHWRGGTFIYHQVIGTVKPRRTRSVVAYRGPAESVRTRLGTPRRGGQSGGTPPNVLSATTEKDRCGDRVTGRSTAVAAPDSSEF